MGRRQAWTGAAAAALLGLLAAMLLPALSDLSYDLGFLFRRVAPPREAVLVKDGPGVRTGTRPARSAGTGGVHARLLDQLRAAGARAVVFDVWFDGASDLPRDQALVDALRRFPRTALAGRMVKVVRALGVFDEEILEGPTP